jgi:stringent starvation protein B
MKTTTKPYLIRAIREWAIDNGYTPQILVDASAQDVQVPQQFVTDGQIILNIDGQAAQMHELTNERLRFSARFRGAPYEVNVPVAAILAIYARENGRGIFFKDTEGHAESDPGAEDQAAGTKPHLTLVK